MGKPAHVLAVAAALAATGAAAVEFGTLFHTAEERAQLDRQRRGEPATATLPERPVVPPEITGYVKRSDGRITVWLDGVPVPSSNPRAAALLDPRNVRDDAMRLPDSAIRSHGPVPAPK